MWRTCAVVFRVWLCVATTASPALAQAHGSEVLVTGLEAQFQASIIRDRRLADDREQRLIAEAEARLRAARASFDQRMAGADASLAAARLDYARLVSEVALRDSAARAEVETYRQEARNLAAQSTPELLDAYQRFADGDQEGAYPVIASLTQAQVNARLAAAHATAAAQVRQQAKLRDIMRAQGRGSATAAEVLALWNQAVELNPQDVAAQLGRARLFLAVCRISEMRAAAFLARALAASIQEPNERARQLYDAHLFISLMAYRGTDLPGLFAGRVELARQAALTQRSPLEQLISEFEGVNASREVCSSRQQDGATAEIRRDLERSIGVVREQLTRLESAGSDATSLSLRALNHQWLGDSFIALSWLGDEPSEPFMLNPPSYYHAGDEYRAAERLRADLWRRERENAETRVDLAVAVALVERWRSYGLDGSYRPAYLETRMWLRELQNEGRLSEENAAFLEAFDRAARL